MLRKTIQTLAIIAMLCIDVEVKASALHLGDPISGLINKTKPVGATEDTRLLPDEEPSRKQKCFQPSQWSQAARNGVVVVTSVTLIAGATVAGAFIYYHLCADSHAAICIAISHAAGKLP